MSLECRQAVGVTHTASATSSAEPQPDALNHAASGSPLMSLQPDQLINRRGSDEKDRSITPATPNKRSDIGADVPEAAELPQSAPHLRDAELLSTRQDAHFWCEVHLILYGSSERYDHTPGERQAALRRFKKAGVPTGVVLAALRALMTLPPAQRPARLADAFKMDLFHACVQQALALLPARAAGATNGTWSAFLQAYRCIGQDDCLRNVSATDYHVLHALFTKQPNECWEVLSRAEHAAQPPALSPAYLGRAIVNNQRAAAQQALLHADQTPACGRVVAPGAEPPPSSRAPSPASQDDPRRVLLEREGLPTDVLTDDMTELFLRAWIAEADARRAEIRKRPNWLRWGLSSRCLPQDHPDLRSRSRHAAPRGEDDYALCAAAYVTTPLKVDPRLAALWQAAHDVLREQFPRDVFETWIRPCRLIALEAGEQAADDVLAIIAAPNIFVREELESSHLNAITQALHAQMEHEVEVRIVIGS